MKLSRQPQRLRTLQQCLTILLAWLCAACATNPRMPAAIAEDVVMLPSRGVQVPATVTRPVASDGDLPLVVLAHGHGGSRDEGGGFDRLARQLAVRGIASIRMDFPGCGDSREPFTANNLGNMLLDIAAARDFAVNHYPVDTGRIAVHGYSMGARLALLSSARHDWAAIAAWAPVTDNHEDAILPFLGGRTVWNRLRAEAEAAGQATFVTRFGQPQALGRRWFSDMASSRPLHAAANYAGPVLAVCGERDDIAPVAACTAIVKHLPAAKTEARHIASADHGFGFFSGDAALSTRIVSLTVDFYDRHLL